MTKIGMNNPSNCKADTKTKGHQEKLIFDWNIQLEKVQLTRELKDDTVIYQVIRLPCKNDQGYCDPTTRIQATLFGSLKTHVAHFKLHTITEE